MVYFLQNHVEIRYQRLMLLLPLVISIIKQFIHPWLETYQISPWKILCLCLIFVINQSNLVILICKLYFLGEVIIFNHPDIFQLGIVVLWLHQSLGQRFLFLRDLPNPASRRTKKNESSEGYKISKMDTFLVGAFAIFINGPSTMLNNILNIYIIGVSLVKGFNSLR